jgi:hemoglobin
MTPAADSAAGPQGARDGPAPVGSPGSPPPAVGGGRRDIAGRADITALLEDFYGRAFADPLLGPVFVDVAHMRLADHLPAIGDFWETVLFRTARYRRNALRPHRQLHEAAALAPAHFERWLTLWTATVDDRHAGPAAETAKRQATRMAAAMCRTVTGRPSAAIQARLQQGSET